jgi:hypothetical protein
MSSIMDDYAKRVVRRRDRKGIQHSSLFWVGLTICLAGIAVYELSDDISWHPRGHYLGH